MIVYFKLDPNSYILDVGFFKDSEFSIEHNLTQLLWPSVTTRKYFYNIETKVIQDTGEDWPF